LGDAAQLLAADQEGAGHRQGQRDPAQGQGGPAQPRAAAQHRRDEDARPQRQQRRAGREDHRRHRPFHGHHRRRLSISPPVGGPLTARDNHKETDMKRSKAHKDAAAKIDRGKLYSPADAARLTKETSTTKFDATVEVAMRLGVDPRKADQIVRGTVNLPHGTGKTARVLVLASGGRAAPRIAYVSLPDCRSGRPATVLRRPARRVPTWSTGSA